MNVLVTGGAGFIGANLSALLATSDGIDRVLVLDDLSTGCPSNLEGIGDRVEFHEGSILDPATVDSLVRTVRAVIHLAARPSVPRSLQDPVASHNVNVNLTLEHSRGVPASGGVLPPVASLERRVLHSPTSRSFCSWSAGR